MVMQQLICVGGPLAGEVYNVDTALLSYVKLAHTVEEGAPAEVVVYAVDRIAFNGRGLLVLWYLELRSEPVHLQTLAIMKAMLRPEAFEAWESGLAP